MLKIAFFSKVASRNCVLHDATAVTFANVTSLGLCQIENSPYILLDSNCKYKDQINQI